MSRIITIKLTKASIRNRLFNIFDQSGNAIASSIDRDSLVNGMSFTVDSSVSSVKVVADNGTSKLKIIGAVITPSDIANTKFENAVNGCLWRHLTRVDLNNHFYGSIHPYIIEQSYPFQFNDEILQSVKDFSRVYQYTPDGTGVYDYNNKTEINDGYFNQAIIYNGQQNSGLLELVKKPKNNLSNYLTYPLYRESSKVITYTKSDSFYNFNTFWNCLIDRNVPQFLNSCNGLSFDKVLNNSNFDYSKKSFKKEPIRGKYTKVRMMLTNRSDIHIVSKINFVNTQISYK